MTLIYMYCLYSFYIKTEEGGGGSPFIVRNIHTFYLPQLSPKLYFNLQANLSLHSCPPTPLSPFPKFEGEKTDAMFRSGISYIQPKQSNKYFLCISYVSKQCIYMYISTDMATLNIDFVDKLILVLYRQFKDFRLLISLSF